MPRRWQRKLPEEQKQRKGEVAEVLHKQEHRNSGKTERVLKNYEQLEVCCDCIMQVVCAFTRSEA